MFSGEALALSAALCWAVCAICFSAAIRRVGSLSVNLLRLMLAFLFLALYGAVTRGHWLPTDAGAHEWLWLLLSGLVGFFVGDMFLFRAFLEIGPRISTLVMSSAPIVAAVGGWLWLGERIGLVGLCGMTVTLGGIAWVVLERRTDGEGERIHVSRRGVFFAFVGAMGQGLGLVLAKHGMTLPGGGNYDAFAATQIRAVAGLICFTALLAYRGRLRGTMVAMKTPPVAAAVTLGALVGPFLGVAFLLRATQLIPTGIAQTLAATVPVMILPFVILVEKERLSWRAGIGALIAVLGVALLFQ
ncbi:DMT family transporter [Candidatus Sumerlaeota bacterium]